MRLVAFILGVVGTLALVVAIVQSMLITRNSRNWISRAVSAAITGLAVAPLRLFRTYVARDRWLSGLAPATLLILLTVYGIGFIFTLGLAVWGSTDLGVWESLYQSGSTFTTLGIVEPTNATSAVVSFVGAFLGLVVVAIFIGYLLALYGMYSSRESVMARLSTYAGEPAWGPEFLSRAAVIGRPASDAPRIELVLNWVSELRLNQEMNPILASFRSTSSNRHWVITTLATMDAVALRLALELSDDVPADIQFLTQGTLTLAELNRRPVAAWTVGRRMLEAVRGNVTRDVPTLSDEEWREGWDEMVNAGITSRVSQSKVRNRVEAMRGLYAPDAYRLAQKHHAIRAPWSGERRLPAPVEWPMRAGNEDLGTPRSR